MGGKSVPSWALLLAVFLQCAWAGIILRPERVPHAQFRIRCNYSHTLLDDPIVFPNQPGKSHSHDFLGSKIANAFTTDPKQLIHRPTTCTHSDDAAAYWFPSLYQRIGYDKHRNGIYEQLKPDWTLFYYRTAVNDPQDIKSIPPGLKMITGVPNAGLRHPVFVNVEWWCGERGKHFSSFPPRACAGEQLIAKLNFPSCWNGRDLDSPDHRSHMKHILLNETCPPAYPVAIPRISIKVYYPVKKDLVLAWPKNGMAGNPPIYLSTAQSGGLGSAFEYHADFMNGWDQRMLDFLVKKCINANLKCLVTDDKHPVKIDNSPDVLDPACVKVKC